MHRIDLPDEFELCPSWWQIFVSQTRLSSIEQLDEILKTQNGFVVLNSDDINDWYIAFDSEQDFLVFRIKYA